MAASSTASATAATDVAGRPRASRFRMLSSSTFDRLMIAGRISSDTRFITLMSGLSAGPAVSLNGSPTVSPMTAAMWASGALAAVVAVLDVLLGVVPGATGVGQVVGHELAHQDHRRQEGAQGRVADAEADDDRGEHGQQGRGGQLPQRGRVQMSMTGA